MRIGYALAVAAMLAAPPAMAQLVIQGGDNDAARHEYRADQDRVAGHQEMNEAREKAARGDYRGAARDQAEAHRDWRSAHHEERSADREGSGVRVEIGH